MRDKARPYGNCRAAAREAGSEAKRHEVNGRRARLIWIALRMPKTAQRMQTVGMNGITRMKGS